MVPTLLYYINTDWREQEGESISIMKILALVKSFLCIFLFLIPIFGYAQTYDVSVPKPGKLASQIKDKKEMVISLTVKGGINSKDILYIRSLPNLEILRLGDAQIVSGGKEFKVQVPIPDNWQRLYDNNKNNTCEEKLSKITECDVLPAGCFSGLKKLLGIELPKSLRKITYNVFWNCPNLEEILISGKVEIYNNSFAGCPKLSRISLRSNGILSGGYISHAIGINNLIFLDEEDMNYSNWNNLEKRFNKIFVPRYIYFQKSGQLALYDSFGSDKIEEGVSIIWQYAFCPDIRSYSGNGTGDQNIKNITIPNTVVTIGYRAFQKCSNLSQVKFSSNLHTIMDEAFESCDLLNIELPSIEYIGKSAFRYNKHLRKCILGDKLTTINDQAFRGCYNLRKIELPETLMTIGNGAFSECKNLSTIRALMKQPAKISVRVNSFDMSFPEESVTTIFVPSEVYDAYIASDWNQYPLAKEGGKSDFDITVKTPGNLLGIIGIDNILSVKNLKLSGTIDDKDMQTIKQMVNLISIDMKNCHIIESQEKKEEDKAYNDFVKGIVGLADKTAKKAYQRGEITTGKYQRVQIGNAMIKASTLAEINPDGSIISSNIFTGFRFLETVLLPQNTIRIAYRAFANCPALKRIKFPDCPLQVGVEAFADCYSLKEIKFLSLSVLGDSSFKGCSQLSSINLPKGLLTIGENVFQSCNQIANVDIPCTVKEIGNLFGRDNGIIEIHCKGNIPPTLKYKTDSDRRYKIYVPTGSSSAYYDSWGKLNIAEE